MKLTQWHIFLAALFMVVAASPVFARSGGGCFLADTPVLMADGSTRPIQSLHVGDQLLAFNPNHRLVIATLQQLFVIQSGDYLLVVTPTRTLRVTPEHPFLTVAGDFLRIGSWHSGDLLTAFDGSRLTREAILSITPVHAPITVYNLQTDEPHTFFAAGVAVHNKGGHSHYSSHSSSHSSSSHSSWGSSSSSSSGSSWGSGSSGGSWGSGSGWSGGYSGGYSHSYYHSDYDNWYYHRHYYGNNNSGNNYSSTQPSSWQPGAGLKWFIFFVEVLVAICVLVPLIRFLWSISWEHDTPSDSSRPSSLGPNLVNLFTGGSDEELDLILPRSQIDPVAQHVNSLLERVSASDGSFSSVQLVATARSTFLKSQECWQARDYGPMRPLMTPELLAQHERLIRSMVANNEVNVVTVQSVTHVDLVHVRYGTSLDDREFTALISANAADCHIDFNTKKIIRGSMTPEPMQEFWTFQLNGNSWYLREIEQTKESDILSQTSDISGLAGDPVAAAPPPLPQDQSKVDRTMRLLDSLAQKDPLWKRSTVATAARNIYTNVYLSREAGSPRDVRTNELTDAFSEHLKMEITQQAQSGTKVEYKNFCVRKIQIVMIKPANAGAPGRFTVRISAHAAKLETKYGQVQSEDPYPKTFTDCCIFVQDQGVWKLQDMSPAIGFSNDSEDPVPTPAHSSVDGL